MTTRVIPNDFNSAVVVDFSAIVKAREDSDGRRKIEVEASVEDVDDEGDVIEQKALLDSAPSFIKHGMIDIDHFGEIGHRLGIPNPESYIIGRPLEVKDIGGKRTSVVGEIRRAANGVHNPALNKYDMIWDALSSKPPVEYRASVYGFPVPGSVIDCRNNSCDSPATRFHIKAMEWKSLALTRSPVNTKIKGPARIVKASAFLLELAKSLNMPDRSLRVRRRERGMRGEHSRCRASIRARSGLTGWILGRA